MWYVVKHDVHKEITNEIQSSEQVVQLYNPFPPTHIMPIAKRCSKQFLTQAIHCILARHKLYFVLVMLHENIEIVKRSRF